VGGICICLRGEIRGKHRVGVLVHDPLPEIPFERKVMSSLPTRIRVQDAIAMYPPARILRTLSATQLSSFSHSSLTRYKSVPLARYGSSPWVRY
jgi:hypothetical protein